MGSSSRENNSTQANAANAAATQQAQQASAISGDQNKKANALFGLQFGDVGKDGKLAGNGSLSGFFDPAKLNVDKPSGPYAAMYTNQVAHQAIDAQHARGDLYSGLNSRGFGDAPSGAAADEMRKIYLDQAQAKGDTFANLTGASYQDALSNFWNAQNAASGQSADLRGNSATNSGHAQQTYTSMYGTAAQPVTTQSPWGQIAGGVLQAGGTVGAAAVCPAVGSQIAMADGSIKSVEELKKGDGLKGRSRTNFLLEDPQVVVRECVSVRSHNGFEGRVSKEHTFPIMGGGYVFAPNAAGESVLTLSGEGLVTDVKEAGKLAVYTLLIDGDHSYNADGLWGLS